MTATLYKSMANDAQALLDNSNGRNTLYDVLKALAECGTIGPNAFVASPSTGIIASEVMPRASRLTNIELVVGTTGTASTTTARVLVNGTAVPDSDVSIANTEADGTSASTEVVVNLEQGDLVQIELTSVGASSANTTASTSLQCVIVE